jgi:ABC-type multidrug transport system ATPase subunit
VCPQFDILWDELTVEEHLLFYARIKGITPEEEDFRVNQALKEVQLVNEK